MVSATSFKILSDPVAVKERSSSEKVMEVARNTEFCSDEAPHESAEVMSKTLSRPVHAFLPKA